MGYGTRLYDMQGSAIHIQRIWRGFVGRQIARERRIQHMVQTRAAIIIQCMYRCRLARRTLMRKRLD